MREETSRHESWRPSINLYERSHDLPSFDFGSILTSSLHYLRQEFSSTSRRRTE